LNSIGMQSPAGRPYEKRPAAPGSRSPSLYNNLLLQ
jgi:hypothetical protein